MIIVDNALAARARAGHPIRVAMIGAGFMARGVARQICRYVPGMELVAIANRTVGNARRAYAETGVLDVAEVGTVAQLEACIRLGRPAVTGDALLVCRAAGVDAIIEVTGAVEYGAHAVMEAIAHGKHVVLLNAELDGTAGPILKVYADRAGIVYTVADGDQPGVTLNLARFVQGIGVQPVLCGNIKGLHDPYRNPTTQEGFARQWGQNPSMVTSFADGSKISFEQAVVANALGMRVARRGMLGPTVAPGTPVTEAASWYPADELLGGGPGLVDYVVGASPGPGVFVLGTVDDPVQRHYLNLYKLGPGPLYCFYTPYHLCHFETPTSVARAVLFHDAALAPRGPLCVEVVAAAKVALTAGQVLDGIGHYHTYGLAENADAARRENLLPMGVAEGCTLRHDVAQDHVLTYADVVVPAGRLIDRLRREQAAHFHPVPGAVPGPARNAALPGGARVFVTSAYADAEPITGFRRAVAADKYGRHRPVDDPAEADLILFIENSHYHDDPFFKRLKNHPLVRQYPNKTFMYNPHDLPWLVLPGLYASMRDRLLDPARVAACCYLEEINRYIYCVFDTEPTHLYSFYGNLRMPVRRELPRLRHPRGVVKEWTFSLYGAHKPKGPQVEFADLLADSKFVLCPRGIGTSSSRLFETMQAGRVPVIISDHWVRPKGPKWEECAVFVPESQVAQIPRLLEQAEARWPAMARAARAAWEEFFAPDAVFHYFVEQLLPLLPATGGMRFPLPLYHRAQFAKYYFRATVLEPAKGFVAAWPRK